MKKIIIVLSIILLSFPCLIFAVEKAPRISDKEIVERLTRLEDGQKNLEKRIDDLRSEMNSRFSDLRSEMDSRFSAVDSRFSDLRSEMNSRFNTLQWMLGLFITISLVILGFVLRMQWQMQKRQTRMETALETQKDELEFIKGLVEKLLPPRSAL